MHKTDITRRDFTAASVMTLLAGVAITITGCDDDNNPANPNPTPSPTATPAGDKVGVISANHGHTATVTAAQITAAGAIALDLRGTADHTHTLELTAAEVVQIGAGTRVGKNTTTNNAHDHMVTFN